MGYWIVGLAGVAGAILRFLLSWSFQGWNIGLFPAATWIANMIGCFFLSWLNRRSFPNLPPEVKMGIGTGLIGSFTTFSTFSVETLELIRHEAWIMAFLYLFSSAGGGLWMAWAGDRVASRFEQDD